MRVLIIGLGSIAQKHIAALKQLCEVEIFALRSSPDSKKQENIIDLHTFEEVAEKDFDFILVSNPTSAHGDTISRLLEHNIPFFIEKPLFHSIEPNHQSIVEQIKQRGIPNYVACNLRFLDAITEIKTIIKDRTVNEVNIYCGSYLPAWRPSVDYRKVYSANKDLGGGVHLDMIHELDYLYWLFGAPVKTSSTFRSKSSLNIDAIDYANYLWEYKEFTANVILNYYRKDTKRSMEIITSDETFTVDLVTNRIFKNGTEIFKSNQTILDTYTAQMSYFINEVLVGKPNSFNDVEEAYQILNLCLKD